MRDRPNIVFFVADEMRADHLGCAGNSIVRTPNLDRLAARGVRFSRAYCNNPICTPARVTMFTGLLPRDHGAWHNNMEMHAGLPVLPELLALRGYRTHGVGKLHLSRWMLSPPLQEAAASFPESMVAWNEGKLDSFPVPYYGLRSVDFVGGHGSYAYGEYFRWLEGCVEDARRLLGPQGALEPPSGAPECYKMGLPAELHYNRWIGDRAIQFIEQAHADGEPFFLWCSFPDPHSPFCPPAPYCHMYDPADMLLPVRREGELDDLPPYYKMIFEKRLKPVGIADVGLRPDDHWREMRALTYGMITFVDAEVGRVLDRLDALGLTDDTVVAFVSDHGDMMGDHWMIYKGPYMFEGCVRVPLIVSLPGGVQGVEHDGLACHLDLLPTVLDMVGVQMLGVERLRTNDHPMPLAQYAGIEVLPGRSLRPLLMGEEGSARESIVIQNDDPHLGLRIRTLVTERVKLTLYPGYRFGEMFDLQNDPGELHNLWDRPEWKALRDELARKLLEQDTCGAPWQPLPHWSA